ncbi:hypothetical protein [Kitasatospora sp. NPDC001132]
MDAPTAPIRNKWFIREPSPVAPARAPAELLALLVADLTPDRRENGRV